MWKRFGLCGRSQPEGNLELISACAAVRLRWLYSEVKGILTKCQYFCVPYVVYQVTGTLHLLSEANIVCVASHPDKTHQQW